MAKGKKNKSHKDLKRRLQKRRSRKTKFKSMVDDGESTLESTLVKMVKKTTIVKSTVKRNTSNNIITQVAPMKKVKNKGVRRSKGANKVSKKKQRKLKKVLKIKATKLKKLRKKKAQKQKQKKIDRTTGELPFRVMKRVTSEKSSAFFKMQVERISKFLHEKEKNGKPIKIPKFDGFFKWLKGQRKLYDSGVLIRLRIDMLNNLHDDYNWLDETFSHQQIEAYDKEIQSRFGWDSAKLEADPWFKKQIKLVNEGALPFIVINKLAMLGIKPSVANVNFDSFGLN